METQILAPTEEAVALAARILREGGLVGLPTETVYGLGANGLNTDAVNRIFLAKGRPQDNPLILHIPGPRWLSRYYRNVPPAAYELAERFWPGPLTMILRRRANVPNAVTAGLDTVGVRCPDHPVTLAIIRAAGVPVAAGRCSRSKNRVEKMPSISSAVSRGVKYNPQYPAASSPQVTNSTWGFSA